MSRSSTPMPVVIDTDGGVDDAAALWWALTAPCLDVLAITTVWGNVPVEVATGVVLRVLAAARRTDVPVAVGAAGPLAPTPLLRRATAIHGEDGLGGAAGIAPAGVEPVPEPAGELLSRVVHNRPGEVSLVTIGPLSSIGGLVLDDPAFASDVDKLVVMGGSARRGGNMLPAGEANVACDPRAAQAVVVAPWPRPPLLVGLDVTHQATLTDVEFELLAQHRSPAARFLDAPLRAYRRFGSTMTAPGCPCHDLLAVMALAEPELIPEAPVLPLAIDCGGDAAWGATIVDFRAPYFAALEGSRPETPPGFADWRIGLGADVERFRARVRSLFGGES